MSEFLDRVRHTTPDTTPSTTLTLSATAYNNGFFTMAEAGGVNGHPYSYVIEEGLDFEIHKDETWNSVANTFTRGTPKRSKIGGTAGVGKMTLSGSASVRLILSADDLTDLYENAETQAIIYG